MIVPCTSCGHLNAADAKFCAECGTKLGRVVAGREMRKTVTVLFADVTGSTALGEQLDPETLRAIMGRYFAMMKAVIEGHGGTVEKFIGDAVMAVFGIPTVHEDDALRAVRAAAEIRTELAALNAELEATRGIAIRFRTGVNTGEVVAGDPAAGQTLVTGDTVNTAARLEQAAPPGEILLGALTWSLVRDAVEVEPVAPIAAKGKALPLVAWRLVAVRAGAAGHARRLDAPLVGRERELGRLEQAFRSAVEERSCGLFTLLGSAGVGKSRLVAEFTASVEPDARVLAGRCLSYGEGITYWPIGEIVRAATGIDEADTADAARTKIRVLLEGEREADILAARVSSAIGLSSEPAPQEELFLAIRKLLEHLAREQPLVLVVEDIHWAEPTLLDLLEHIADWSRDAPLLVLCPARPELLDVRPGWGGGKLNATTVLLEPLGADAAGRLVAALPGGSALPPAVVERIQTAAEGNPLYVEELLAMLVDEGLLRQQPDGTWHADPGIAEVRVPATISALLSARLERLAPAERSVAERASVVGRIFEQAAVSELADEELRPEVARSLLALVRKELVRPDRSELSAGDAFRFRHILIRDAAYEALPKAQRAILHEHFADWLERTAGERLAEVEEIVGHHLGEAHRYRIGLGESGLELERLGERAGERLAAAGRRAMDRQDVRGSAMLLGRAVDLSPPEATNRSSLLLDLAEVSMGAGELARSREAIDRVLRDSSGDPLSAARARYQELCLRNMSDPSATFQRKERELRSLIGEFSASNDQRYKAKSLRQLWATLNDLGHADEAVLLEQAVADDEGSPIEGARLTAISFLPLAASNGSRPASEVVRMGEISADLLRGHPWAMGSVLIALGMAKAMMGNLEPSLADLAEAHKLAEMLGQRLIAAGIQAFRGYVCLLFDQPNEAAEALRVGYHILDSLGETGYKSTHAGYLAHALYRLGQAREAEQFSQIAKDAAAPDDYESQVLWRGAQAKVLAAQGRFEEGIGLAREAVEIASDTDNIDRLGHSLMDAAEVFRMAGKSAEEMQSLRRALILFERKGNVVAAGKVQQLLG